MYIFCLFYLCLFETNKNQIKPKLHYICLNLDQKFVAAATNKQYSWKKKRRRRRMNRRDSFYCALKTTGSWRKKAEGSWQWAVWVWNLDDMTGQWPLHTALLPPQDIVFWPRSVFNYSSCPGARQIVLKKRGVQVTLFNHITFHWLFRKEDTI